MLDLVYENQTGQMEWDEKFFARVLEHALVYLKLDTKQAEVGLQLVSPARSQELNVQHRHKDKPTDVLSFPLNPALGENSLKRAKQILPKSGVNDHTNKEYYGILPLGDIFICLDVAKQQAKELNIPVSQELARLVVHGLLHLLDYDHERSEKDEQEMIDLQEKILKDII